MSPDRKSRIQSAIKTIGADQPSDYVIAPSKHASLYLESAPELAARLSGADVQVAGKRYEERDALAGKAQKAFTSTSARARNAVFAAGVSGALLVATGSLSGVLDDAVERVLVIAFTVGGITASALATARIRRIKEGKLLEQWMTHRAEAESQRVRYFDIVTRGEPLSEPLLQLEYFRRYQLDVQRLYYTSRANDHREAGERSLSVTTAAIATAGVATGLAGVLGASLGAEWTSLAGVGLIASAAASREENREATAQSRRNAERFDRTRDTIDQLTERLDVVRAATAAGELAVMHEFVAAVQDQISLEHRQWLEQTRDTSEAVGRLEDLLQEYKSRTEQKV